MLERFIDWLLQTLLQLGYPGIIALMAMESSILPVPSELVMPPAGYWAAKGQMSFPVALLCGVLGSVIGALANYYGAQLIGRPLIQRYGKYVLLSEKNLQRSERFFAEHGEISTLIGRLFPVIRHLISIPAGLHRMALPKFILYTAVGATVWCAILTWIGYFLGQHEGVLRNEEIHRYVTRALLILIPLTLVTVLVYVLRRRRQRRQPI
ncbi:MAG: DedA family protein [Gemmatimonadetes bacterium]|nr:MAG: DedA family protein [Gemmatimonadota bacterium]HYU27775.1 DedA family protein [Gemmatimonadales bacterium]